MTDAPRSEHWTDTELTPQDMHDWGCCEQDDRYSLAGIEELLGARFTLRDVLQAGAEGRIPPEDALWVLHHERSPIPARVRAMLACDYAEHALPLWEEWARHHAPQDLDRPRRRIAAARTGLLGEGEWSRVEEARRRLEPDSARIGPVASYVTHAAKAAARAAESAAARAAESAAARAAESDAESAAAHAAKAAAESAAARAFAESAAVFAAADAASADEHQWQVARAIEVLEEEKGG